MESAKNIKKISYEESVRRTIPIMSELLKDIKYGYIQITVQDGRVVQIDKTEKFRFNGQKLNQTIKMDKQLINFSKMLL